jgi:hypothetical protein
VFPSLRVVDPLIEVVTPERSLLRRRCERLPALVAQKLDVDRPAQHRVCLEPVFFFLPVLADAKLPNDRQVGRVFEDAVSHLAGVLVLLIAKRVDVIARRRNHVDHRLLLGTARGRHRFVHRPVTKLMHFVKDDTENVLAVVTAPAADCPERSVASVGHEDDRTRLDHITQGSQSVGQLAHADSLLEHPFFRLIAV